ncbi:MAG: DNA mismatch repair endonuclease MutL [Candidatus Enterosoma sp.]|nr:DNA mismatch repair endonuclease MutL [Bacilli bacterium]MDD7181246.1 DNA mismatch repair endonuclease MutL [Bacilli bacterium]MDY3046771.1 DNA mismatch repair endonuclease MutL [Candidatus Enterosoma sp.]
MSRIELMRPELANLIAAGEVIERPSSVIKELVENSIDAESKNIYVGVTDGGKGTILVKDDGYGMDREDAIHCFLRHASSKIKTEFDLNRIHTLGFRGEAIPSIAAVSKVVLTTCSLTGVGTRVESNPNEELRVSDAPSRKGTVFEVSNLFFNTPARLKYLRSQQAETYSIIETVEHLALGFPNISFSLVIDGREIFRTSGRNDLLECIQKIYGNTIVQSLYPIKKEGVAYSFSGFISKPEINYSRRKDMLTFLNHRSIYDYKINKAIEDAYKDYLPPLRYPFDVICLDIDSSLVDVNVHPTKKEVRISMEDEIARDIKNEVIKTLEMKKPIYFASQDPKSEKLMGKNDDPLGLELDEEKEVKEEPSTYPVLEEKDEKVYFQDSLPIEENYVSKTPYVPTFKKEENVITPKAEEKPAIEIPSIRKPEAYYQKEDYYNTIFNDLGYSHKLPEMHPIGQVLDTYIICDSKDGLYMIDQHAAAERINYEKTEALFASIRSRIVPLIPITIDLTPKEEVNFDEEHIARLASVGIMVESFGPHTAKAMEIPSFLNEGNMNNVIQDCVHACLNDEACDPLSLLHLTIATIACKMSIKANHVMPLSEMEALLRDLAKCKNPANCPHGRPTMIRLTKDDIERIFRRSGF